MNLVVSICLILGIIFLVFSLIFAILKGKGAILVSGFNSFSKKERDDYGFVSIFWTQKFELT